MAKKEKVYGTHLKVSTKRAGHKIGGTVGIFVFLLVLALFMALPIYLAVVMSLKPVQELFVFPPKLYVIDPTLSNYSAMFRLCSDLWVPFSRYVFNSIFVTVSVTVCQVIFSAMAAFCLARCVFPVQRRSMRSSSLPFCIRATSSISCSIWSWQRWA
mgnify:CR=1 FL=1